MKPSLTAFLMILGVLASDAADEPAPAKLPQLESDAINEASGLTVSPTQDGLLWALNDSGGSTDLHLIGPRGEDRGKIKLEGATNRDWEDLASFTLNGSHYLLIADTGDNQAKHETSGLLILREPTLPGPGKKLAGSTKLERTIAFRFEGGPVDCESVAVDAISGKILLLGKRMEPPVLYELPLKPAAGGIQTARKIGTTKVESPSGLSLRFANQPTGLALSRDSRMAAVVTYYGVFVFPRSKQESWVEAFARKPVPLGPHGLPQAESIAFSAKGDAVHVVSEGRHSMIRSLPVKVGK